MVFDDENQKFTVVVNDEDQYSIWPVGRDVPAGWTVIGDPAPKAECLSRIDELWTDMRPASLRAALDAQQGGSTASP